MDETPIGAFLEIEGDRGGHPRGGGGARLLALRLRHRVLRRPLLRGRRPGGHGLPADEGHGPRRGPRPADAPADPAAGEAGAAGAQPAAPPLDAGAAGPRPGCGTSSSTCTTCRRRSAAALGNGRRFGLRIRYSREPAILGTGGGPRAVRELFGDEPLLLVNGDVLFDFDLRRLLAAHRALGRAGDARPAAEPGPVRLLAGRQRTGRAGSSRSRAGPGAARGPVSMFASVHVLDPRAPRAAARGRLRQRARPLHPAARARARTCRACARGARGTISAAPSLYRDAQLRLLPGRGRDRVARGREGAGRRDRPAPPVGGRGRGRGSAPGPGSSAASCGTGRWSRRARASRARSWRRARSCGRGRRPRA